MFWNWVTGKRLSPENLNGFKTAYKSVTEDRAGTTLLVDADLLFPVQPLEVWAFQMNVFVQSTLVGDIKFSIGFPTGAACTWGVIGGNSGTPANLENQGFDTPTSAVTTRTSGTNGTQQIIPVFGAIFNSTNAGNVQLYWSLNALDGVNTASVRKGSHLIATRLE